MLTTVPDHLQRPVTFEFPPRRVVSLCPSLTETLFALGSGSVVVGRTRFCIHPAEAVGAVAVVGGTKDVDVGAVRRLGPDLVVAEKEENRPQDIAALAQHSPVFVVDVNDYPEALRAIRDLGALVERTPAAAALVDRIRRAFDDVTWSRVLRAAYLIWRWPYMAAGADTYIHAVLGKCGLENVCARLPGRYPHVSLSQLQALRPELVLLSSEPFPFQPAHAEELSPALAGARILCVDGALFSWYGSRMVHAARTLRTWRRQLED